jgi:hypothetical protein
MLGQFSSGLVIYWCANNILTFMQQYGIMRSQGVDVDFLGNVKQSFKRKKPGSDAGADKAAKKDDSKQDDAKQDEPKADAAPQDGDGDADGDAKPSPKPLPKPKTPRGQGKGKPRNRKTKKR